MTDEERQELCAELRIQSVHPCGAYAADEIERLAALAQSDAGPDDPLPRQHQDPSKWVMEPEQSDAGPARDVRDDQWLSLVPVTFWYQNYRGEVSRRVAMITGMRWGSSEYHKEPQWLLRAFDLEKEADREFAIKDMAPTREALAQSDAGGDADERRQELVEALKVAPFISADESLRRCREGAEEILELIEIAAAWRRTAEAWERLASACSKT